ncbi:NAD(+) diphosphatase [Trinickia fusca]|uniref:NAD(+) diphosphatase n=2 Tax=Trinickia fusca TaxID=2419777 RepID=A0A494X940_9BURK|nr:NAD(+) diphosphatase [Trinickia fusca]
MLTDADTPTESRDTTPVIATGTNPLAGIGVGLNRYSERRDDDAWLVAIAASPAARYIVLDADLRAYTCLTPDGLRLLRLDTQARDALLPRDANASFLGEAEGHAYFALRVDALEQVVQERLAARAVDLREEGLSLPTLDAGLFAYAKGLFHWQQSTRFCSRCGARVERRHAGHLLQCTAPECAQPHYARTDPAIIVLVEHEGACLLGRHANWTPGRYSLIAGFVDPGETLESAVRREVAEETGVQVGAVFYHSSQPWPMPASLMLGFSAVALSREMEPRDQELEDVRWFTPRQIVAGLDAGELSMPTPLSVSYCLISDWLLQRAGIDLGDVLAGRTGGGDVRMNFIAPGERRGSG